MGIEYEREVSPTKHEATFSEVASDFLTSNPLPDAWSAVAINSGTVSGAGISATVNHPGITTIVSSTNANSGYLFKTLLVQILIGGGEETVFIFKTPAVINAGTTVRMGFDDSNTVTDPVDGIYFSIANTTLQGNTMDNSSQSVTGTTYTVAAGTWYRAKLVVNADATLITYTLYSEAGAVLWTDTIATNIPTGAARFLGHGITASNSGTTAVILMYIDYMNIRINRTLTR